MTIEQYIAGQPEERQALLQALHRIIAANDTTVTATVGPMMGKEMILYHAPGTFKYGLAGGKSHMSLHALPIYMNPALYEKYKQLMPRASFQKGCINFKSAGEVPQEIVAALIGDCAKIDLLKIREDYQKSRKSKSK